MHYYDFNIVFQEVPGEISLCYSISGCSLQCKGCHSPFLWKKGTGNFLSDEVFIQNIEKYKGMATCVLFMGGEWHKNALIQKLKIARNAGLKTCLYTGEDSICTSITDHLDYLKTGRWIQERGGLSGPNTNQVFYNLKTKEKLNKLFTKTLAS